MSDRMTLGKWRRLTADLPDETPIILAVPVGEDQWEPVAVSVTAFLRHPQAVLIAAGEETMDPRWLSEEHRAYLAGPDDGGTVDPQ